MYRKKTANQTVLPHDFFLPFGGKLNAENRWVKLADLVPWSRVEDEYSKQFKRSFKGQEVVSVRVALGALIIQQRLGLSDRDVVEQITENPYLQYFIGLTRFQDTPPFHPSLMVHFRKRLSIDVLNQVNEWMVMKVERQKSDDSNDDDNGTGSGSIQKDTNQNAEPKQEQMNQGKLLLDATCAPADIAFPTDLSLLNEAREKLEDIIDALHAARTEKQPKPRTYRNKARRQYLLVAKQKKSSFRVIRKAIGRQLRYVRRDLQTITCLADEVGLTVLSRSQHRHLLVINELYRQPDEMYHCRQHRTNDRIVSITQPHVRPMVRGKAKANVEFGAKVAVSVVAGYTFMERLDWNNFHEGTTLQLAVEAYYQRHGFYPEAVLADKAYRNRDNLAYCKALGIRLSGPALGRPSKDSTSNKKIERQDSAERNAVEGKFGEAKRRYGLGLIRARLEKTSETVIALQLMVMNLEKALRDLLLSILHLLLECANAVRFTPRQA